MKTSSTGSVQTINKLQEMRLPTAIPLFGSAAAAYGWKLGASAGYVGQGMIMGNRVCLSMLAGSVAGFGILAPLAVRKGWASMSDTPTGSPSTAPSPSSSDEGSPQDTYAALQAADGELPALSLDAMVNDIPGLQTQIRRVHDDVALQSLKSAFQEHCNSESTAERIRGECNMARLHSVIDSGAFKFMDAMPFCIFLQMNDRQFKSGAWASVLAQ